MDKKNGFPNNKGGVKHYSHCGRNDNIVDVCYKKHGFPPGHKVLNTKTKSSNDKVDDEQEVKFTQ